MDHNGRRVRRAGALLLSLLFLTVLGAGGTAAYLADRTDPLRNEFAPAQVSCAVTETFDGETKREVSAVNRSDIDVYIRVKLVSYRVNEAGEHIGGAAAVPSFTPGENWVAYEGHYYYTLPVAPGERPAADLIDRMELTSVYDDADGGRQAVEVMAEAIQSEPARAVGESWGVAVEPGRVTAYVG